MTQDTGTQGGVEREAWKDLYVDKRGCGGCTVRQFEQMQKRLIVGLKALSR